MWCTIATLAQPRGTSWTRRVAHANADTTPNVYMQQIEEGVKQTLDAI